MFARYSIAATPERLAERFGIDVPEGYRPRYNAAPTQLLPVITHDSPDGISFFYWGAPPERTKNKSVSERIINIRFESLAVKPVLRKALTARRCLVPADGFYAWKRVGKKSTIPYRFLLRTADLFAVAAVWEEYEDEAGGTVHSFSTVTLPSNEIVGSVNERMPAILEKPNERIWLDPNSDETELIDLLQPYPGDRMTSHPVSPRINSLTNDDVKLTVLAPPADQYGNLSLFD
jgi:putative SOS response-associated peptidase YedK